MKMIGVLMRNNNYINTRNFILSCRVVSRISQKFYPIYIYQYTTMTKFCNFHKSIVTQKKYPLMGIFKVRREGFEPPKAEADRFTVCCNRPLYHLRSRVFITFLSVLRHWLDIPHEDASLATLFNIEGKFFFFADRLDSNRDRTTLHEAILDDK